jgi:Skp family chaperone for outer membrane proteins
MMKMRVLLALFLVTALGFNLQTRADGPAPVPKIAIVNPVMIFSQLKEVKALQDEMTKDMAAVNNELKTKQDALQQLRAQLNNIKPDSPQYQAASDDFTKQTIELEVWQKVKGMELSRKRNNAIKQVFDKITQAVGEYAQEKGYDIVLAQKQPTVPDNVSTIPTEQLQQLLIERNMLYVKSGGAIPDITQAIITKIDAKDAQ